MLAITKRNKPRTDHAILSLGEAQKQKVNEARHAADVALELERERGRNLLLQIQFVQEQRRLLQFQRRQIDEDYDDLA